MAQGQGQSQSAIDDETQQLVEKIQQLDTILAAASENGLFSKNHDKEFDQLKSLLTSAKTALSGQPADKIGAVNNMQDFYRLLDRVQRDKGTWWMANHEYALSAWAYITAALLLVFYLVSRTAFFSSTLSIVVMWGVLGGIAQGYYWLWQAVSDRTFRMSWSFWILSLPLAGGLFGAFAYLFILGGLVTLSSGSGSIVNNNFAFLLAALSGFSWKDIVDLFSQVWKNIKVGS